MCRRLQHRTCKTSRAHFASHGLGAHGYSTERARLAGGTSLRSWLQKKCLLPGGILIFFSKKSPIFKIQVGFFSTYKSFWNFLRKYGELSLFKLYMTEVSTHLRNFFFSKNPRFWKFKLDFFPLEKVFEILWRNTMNKRLLNYLWLKFQEICGIFFFHKIPPILKVEVGFFSDRKRFSENG